MRIGIQTWGSEGDIRPLIALGAALTRRGHQVELLYTEISTRRYEHVAAALGFTARAVASPVIADRARENDIGLAAIGARDEFSQGLLIFRELLDPVVEPMYEAGLALCARSDLLIHHFILHPSRAAAEKTGTPAATVAFAHMLAPSRYLHPSGLPDFGPWANRIEWAVACFALNQTLLKRVNRFRVAKALPKHRDLLRDAWASHRLHLLASSAAFLKQRPADWPAANQLCGFLELPAHEHEQLAPEVDAFLSSGPPPVFMGLGSLMPISGPHLEETIEVFERAASRAGCRAIIQSEAIRESTGNILFINRAPHQAIFPRCAAVVHHAGAGTTHTTLRAGTPSVPVPHVSDQFLWSKELQRLGVAPAPLRRTKWSAPALADRIIQTLNTPSMKQAALAMSQRMRDDNGPERAADLVERILINDR
ncbi:MAG TPA: glycosyltransferase [Vicinamibacterales bacterium]|nr:glycosyltransferase [Vicinamibacterales bacterium]